VITTNQPTNQPNNKNKQTNKKPTNHKKTKQNQPKQTKTNNVLTMRNIQPLCPKILQWTWTIIGKGSIPFNPFYF